MLIATVGVCLLDPSRGGFYTNSPVPAMILYELLI